MYGSTDMMRFSTWISPSPASGARDVDDREVIGFGQSDGTLDKVNLTAGGHDRTFGCLMQPVS
jgi:hypothetical protein